MIVLHILAWIFIVVLIVTVNQFTLAIYDALNARTKPFEGAVAVAVEVLQETVFMFLSVLTYVLGFINYDALFLKKGPSSHPPVLLVHGYMMNRACFLYVHVRLALAGYRVFTVNLYPPALSITELSDRVADKMDEIAEKTGEKQVYLVGHSMGGLVSRYYANSARGDGRIKGLITIASPHRGTKIAVLGIGKNAREMVPGSDFLSALNSTPLPPVFALWSTLDNLIIPAGNGFMDGMENEAVPLKGHMALLYSGAVYRRVVARLSSPAQHGAAG